LLNEVLQVAIDGQVNVSAISVRDVKVMRSFEREACHHGYGEP
jgi:hypothetical protein